MENYQRPLDWLQSNHFTKPLYIWTQTTIKDYSPLDWLRSNYFTKPLHYMDTNNYQRLLTS